ncbi:MAG: hypothetical protein K2Z81_24505 [Cyanobacteria bacterium]|nr:hypothetical protein [Cyanobacteriota bacterium]
MNKLTAKCPSNYWARAAATYPCAHHATPLAPLIERMAERHTLPVELRAWNVDNESMSLIFRILLNGFILVMVLPGVFHDIKFHGDFWPQGVIAGLIFAVVVWLVELALAVFGILTLGLGFILRYVLWFLVPALQLWAMGHYFPQYLTIGSAQSDILAGFLLMLVNVITGIDRKKKKDKKKDD